ncbi:MAG: hypothetical protein AAF702_49605 [Chloroflexota bacterium]
MWIAYTIGGLFICGIILTVIGNPEEGSAEQVAFISEPTDELITPEFEATEIQVNYGISAEVVAEEIKVNELESIPTRSPTPYALETVSIYDGPGVEYQPSASALAGQQLIINGIWDRGGWYQLHSGHWIEAHNVANPPLDLPILVLPAVAGQADVQPDTLINSLQSTDPESTAISLPPVPTPLPTPVPTNTLAPQQGQPLDNGPSSVELLIITNSGEEEVLGIRNNGSVPVDISNSKLWGEKGPEECFIPRGTIIQPGQTYHVATGVSDPPQPGYKCGDKTIWLNSGEDIFYLWSGGHITTRSYKTP